MRGKRSADLNRKILTVVAAFALVGGTFAPAAFAGGGDDHHHHRDRGDYHDRYEHRDRHDHRGGGWGDGRHHDRHGGGHGHRPREVLYVIHYHLDGGVGRVKVKSEDRAERVVDLLRSVGAYAHIDGSRVLHFKMRGRGRIVRRSHEDAHRLAQKLEGYGFHARVTHE